MSKRNTVEMVIITKNFMYICILLAVDWAKLRMYVNDHTAMEREFSVIVDVVTVCLVDFCVILIL